MKQPKMSSDKPTSAASTGRRMTLGDTLRVPLQKEQYHKLDLVVNAQLAAVERQYTKVLILCAGLVVLSTIINTATQANYGFILIALSYLIVVVADYDLDKFCKTRPIFLTSIYVILVIVVVTEVIRRRSAADLVHNWPEFGVLLWGIFDTIVKNVVKKQPQKQVQVYEENLWGGRLTQTQPSNFEGLGFCTVFPMYAIAASISVSRSSVVILSDAWDVRELVTALIYGVCGLAMAATLAFGVATKIAAKVSFYRTVSIFVVQDATYNMVWGVWPPSEAVTNPYFLIVASASVYAAMLFIFFFRHRIFGILTRVFAKGRRQNIASTLAQTFAINVKGPEYVAEGKKLFRFGKVAVSTASSTSPSLYSNTSPPRWSRLAQEVSFGKVDYFVIASPTIDVPPLLSKIVTNFERELGRTPTFWDQNSCRTILSPTDFHNLSIHLPVAAAGCTKSLVILSDDLLQHSVSILQLFAGLAVHFDLSNVEVVACGRYLNLFSSQITDDISKFDVILHVSSARPTNSDGADIEAVKLLRHLADVYGAGFNAGISHLNDVVKWRCTKAQQQMRQYEFDYMYDILIDRGLLDAGDDADETRGHVNKPVELSRESIELLTVIGGGQFGSVRKALYTPSDTSTPQHEVAVKMLHPGSANESTLKEILMAEAFVNAQLVHQYVVSLIGVVTVGKPVLMVIQLCSKGSLLKYLSTDLDIPQFHQRQTFVTDMCGKVAQGMRYLAERHFVHRDLACRNVLVDAADNPKISDFGMTRLLDSADSEYFSVTKDMLLPIRWCAPETFAANRVFSVKSDCWAFGICCIEAFQLGTKPYFDVPIHEIMEKVSQGYVHPAPHLCPLWLYDDVIRKCLRFEPNERIEFDDICEKFQTGLTRTADIESNNNNNNNNNNNSNNNTTSNNNNNYSNNNDNNNNNNNNINNNTNTTNTTNTTRSTATTTFNAKNKTTTSNTTTTTTTVVSDTSTNKTGYEYFSANEANVTTSQGNVLSPNARGANRVGGEDVSIIMNTAAVGVGGAESLTSKRILSPPTAQTVQGYEYTSNSLVLNPHFALALEGNDVSTHPTTTPPTTTTTTTPTTTPTTPPTTTTQTTTTPPKTTPTPTTPTMTTTTTTPATTPPTTTTTTTPATTPPTTTTPITTATPTTDHDRDHDHHQTIQAVHNENDSGYSRFLDQTNKQTANTQTNKQTTNTQTNNQTANTQTNKQKENTHRHTLWLQGQTEEPLTHLDEDTDQL